MIAYYETKLQILTNFIIMYIKEQVKHDKIIPNCVVLDGGECTGTTTATRLVKESLEIVSIFCESIREPSVEAKKNFIAELENNGDLKTPNKENVNYITDIFMKDRFEIQSSLNPDKLYLSDRGIFSTFVYQSGILNTDIMMDDFVDNCTHIVNSVSKFSIKLPKLTFLFGSFSLTDEDADRYEFMRRIDQKFNNGIGNAMDEIGTCLLTNKIYTDIANVIIPHLNKYEKIFNIISIEHKHSPHDVSSNIKKIIQSALFIK